MKAYAILLRSFCSNLGNKTYQVVLFSATFPDHVRKFAEKFAPGKSQFQEYDICFHAN